LIVAVKDLRPELLGVRDQGRRPTCLAFATSAANEQHAMAAEHLSVEYLYYHAIGRTPGGYPGTGTTMAAAAQALLHDGQPAETEWPYLSVMPIHWGPPTIAGPAIRGELQVGKLTFDGIVAQLNAGHPVILGLIIGDKFYQPDQHGCIAPSTTDISRGGHAVLAIGYGTDLENDFLLIRNSWGATWGLGGHAWLRRDFIDLHLQETATFEARRA
jgi:C1A family cysteine protease